jgi:uncharacterized protein
MARAVAIEPPAWLVAWLHLTNDCTFRCAYCYVRRSPEAMAPETGRQAIQAIFRSATGHGFSGVKLKYGGGEPTLRFSTLADLHRLARKLAAAHGLALDGVVLSNGAGITPEMVGAMQSLELRLAVSLDGVGAWHDAQRPLAGGRGSCAAVAGAIDRALRHGLVPELSITASGRNLSGLPDLVQWALERELPFRIEFYRETGLPAAGDGLAFEPGAMIDALRAAFGRIEARLPRHSLLNSLVDRADLGRPHLRACAAGHNYLVIDPRGRVAKCQMDMAHTVTGVSDPDPLRTVMADRAGVQNLSVDDKEGCRDCEWRYGCAGGCPLATYRATGRYDVPSPHCAVYRTLYPDLILIKYPNP